MGARGPKPANPYGHPTRCGCSPECRQVRNAEAAAWRARRVGGRWVKGQWTTDPAVHHDPAAVAVAVGTIARAAATEGRSIVTAVAERGVTLGRAHALLSDARRRGEQVPDGRSIPRPGGSNPAGHSVACRCSDECVDAHRGYRRAIYARTRDRDDDAPAPTLTLIDGLGQRAPVGEWAKQAECRHLNPDLFFPERGEPVTAAKAVCAGCPVRAECLDYALANGEKHGIWGGTSERERRRMRRTLKVAS